MISWTHGLLRAVNSLQLYPDKCDVIITSSIALNIEFLHYLNLLILGYIHCNFCLNPQIIHRDIKENVSGCFFSEHSVDSAFCCSQMLQS